MNNQNSPNNSSGRFYSKAAPAATALAITASFIFVPLAGTLAVSFLPAAVAYGMVRHGVASAALTSLFCAGLAFFATGSFAMASMVLLFCLSGHVLGGSVAAGEPGDKAILKASLLPLMLALPAAATFFVVAGINPWTVLEKGLNMSLQESIKIYQQMGMSQADIDALKPSLQLVVRLVTDYFPALVVWMMVGAASMSALRVYLARKGLPGGVQTVITTWYAPDHAVWGLIVPGFLMIPDYHPLRIAAGNVLASVAIIYLFQGFAVVNHLFDKIRLTGFLRGLTLVFFMLQPFLILVMWAVGVFDTWADFRKVRPGAKPKV
jgi:uncharacterized protein YybS (DUF2232 family)